MNINKLDSLNQMMLSIAGADHANRSRCPPTHPPTHPIFPFSLLSPANMQ